MKGRLVFGFFAGVLILSSFFVPARIFAGNPPDQSTSKITTTAAPADGSTTSTVTIVLKDAGGNTLTGNDSITITSSNSTAIFDPSSFTLDGSGTITTHMRTTTTGSVPITITDTSTSNTQLTWSVQFYQPGTASPTPTPTPDPNACTDAAPGSTVKITAAESSGDHSITLTWTDAANPVTYYLLSYGLSSGNYIYGVPNIGGQGTTAFTVAGLTTGKTYYFVIRAGNGCTPGTFSNEMSAVPGAAATPQPEADRPLDETSSIAEIPTDTPTPPLASSGPAEAITPAPAVAGSNSSISYIMIGATALGVVCAVVGAYLLIRMKKRQQI